MNFPNKSQALLVVIDTQEKLMNAIPSEEREPLIKNAEILIESAKTLGIPIIVTEQYPKGLGSTIEEIKEKLGEYFNPIEKVAFSCTRVLEFKSILTAQKKRDIVLCGIETHVCVLQTAVDLIKEGYNVFVPVDAVASRKRLDWEVGIKLIEKAGAIAGTVETFLFQMLERAGTDEFKRISKLIK